MKFNTSRGPGFLEMRIQVHMQVNLQKLIIHCAGLHLLLLGYTLRRLASSIA